MHTLSIKQLSEGLRTRKFSARELTEHFLARIEQFDDTLNSFITVTPDRALADANRADQKLRAGEGGPLTGIPIAHKDIFCTEGIKTSCGSKMLDNFIAPYDAGVSERLTRSDAVLIGKTNMDEFAMGSSTETSFYGPSRNPWDPERVPGGSSGGSAAAVAARLAPAATGTDTGGSIRQPCAFCGITGIKPTYGRVSRYGMIAFASSLDQGGPMARTAEDCALLLAAMAGFDPRDSTSIDRDVEDYPASLDRPLAGLKIGLPKEYLDDERLNPDMAAVIMAAIEEYRALGAELVKISLPNTQLAVPVYYIVAPAEASSNLARYDGVRYGHRCDNPDGLLDLFCRSRGEGFGAEVKRRILVGTYALSAGYYDAYYLKAQQLRRLLSEDFKQAFEKVDVVMGTVTPGPAFKIAEKTRDPVQMYLSDIFTIAANLAGLPAMTIPAGFQNNLPVGLQLIGNYFDEARLLSAAHQFQQATGWHLRMPAAFV